MTVQLRTLEETRIEKPSVRAKPKLGHTRASAFALVFVDASNVRTRSSRVINAIDFHTHEFPRACGLVPRRVGDNLDPIPYLENCLLYTSPSPRD